MWEGGGGGGVWRFREKISPATGESLVLVACGNRAQTPSYMPPTATVCFTERANHEGTSKNRVEQTRYFCNLSTIKGIKTRPQ